MKLTLQILLPILVLVAAGLGAWKLVDAIAPPPRITPPVLPPVVRVATVRIEPIQVDVHAQGTVEARALVDLASQVGGRITAVSPALRNGAFFAADEVLVQIEPADYQLAVVQQEAALARAQLRLAQEQAERDAAIAAWRRLEGDRPADPLVTRAPQLAEAEAAVRGAEAALERARLDLQRTRIAAPFAGRVISAGVEVGQLVMAGQTLARIHPTDVVEVRLPVADRELEFLDVPLHRSARAGQGPSVELTAEFAGRRHRWTGTIDRTEGEIDRRTRQVTLVAQVREPFAAGEDPSRPPLAVGMFVAATIRGRVVPDCCRIPRPALRNDGTVLVVDRESRLRFRPVTVLRAERDTVLVAAGLADGEQVCLSNLDVVSDGMTVRIADATGAPELPPALPESGAPATPAEERR